MWVPACPSCVTINIDIDTATTSTTRSWSIRVTQYECGNDNLIIPEENCLQYHTAQTGRARVFLPTGNLVLFRIVCHFQLGHHLRDCPEYHHRSQQRPPV